ncbi:MAG: CheR family methyltransferase [Candidatus Xenobia bacterium]
MTAPMEAAVSAADFRYVQQLVYQVAGNVVEDGKSYLVPSRLTPLASHHGLPGVAALLQRARQEPALAEEIVECMTTRETMFFRDPHLFDALREHLFIRRGRPIDIWCIGCATGQEAYSLVMLLQETPFHLLATDLCRDALATARQGTYNAFEVQRGLPADLRDRCMRPVEDRWEVLPELRKQVDWRRLNLIEPWPALPPMDLIMLRNVLIYFDDVHKTRILEGVRRQLRPDGWLVLGAPENLMSWPDLFTPMQLGRSLAYRPV